jgi:hypothetical protein
MPQAFFRATFFFEGFGTGWSEQIHLTTQNQAVAIASAIAYANLRIGLLVPPFEINDIRLSDDAVFRDILFDALNLPYVGTFPSLQPAAPSSTALLKLAADQTATPSVRRNMFIRGIPSSIITGRNYTPTANWITALGKFVPLLANGAYGIKAKTVGNVKAPIVSVIAATRTVTTNVDLVGVAQGSVLQILGVPRSRVKQRTFTAESVTDLRHVVLRSWPYPDLVGTGFFRLLNYTIYPIKIATVFDIGERRTGRPFGVPRGRAALVR